eukprot:m.41623 g.41623  ORF g.41623 m.41623 type:complete len:54 (+) comp33208_c0_seq1:1953-2114(+)
MRHPAALANIIQSQLLFTAFIFRTGICSLVLDLSKGTDKFFFHDLNVQTLESK